MMVGTKRIYTLMIEVNKLFFFSSSRYFLKEIENMFPVFLSSYRNTRESLGELEKAVETLACGSCSHSISRSPKLSLVAAYNGYRSIMVFNKLGFKIKQIYNAPVNTMVKILSAVCQKQKKNLLRLAQIYIRDDTTSG